MPYRQTGNCWQCGQLLKEADYARESRCSQCQAATHVCRNCHYYATNAPAQCREPVADAVSDKQKANFCGYFQAGENHQSQDQAPNSEALRQAADDLFDL